MLREDVTMPNAKGRVPKSKAKAKPKEDNDEENNVIDTDMAVEETAQDVEGAFMPAAGEVVTPCPLLSTA